MSINYLCPIVWNDGSLGELVLNSRESFIKLYGGKRIFFSFEEMEDYYKGTLKVNYKNIVMVNKYKIRRNELFNEYQTSHDEIGVCESFKNFKEAIEYCLKG